jgi:hypothetical protein
MLDRLQLDPGTPGKEQGAAVAEEIQNSQGIGVRHWTGEQVEKRRAVGIRTEFPPRS